MLSSSICRRIILFHVSRKEACTINSSANRNCFHLCCSSPLGPQWNIFGRFNSSHASETTAKSSPSPPPSVSLTVSYLVDSLGLSAKAATAVAKRVQIKDPNRPDEVLKLLKDHGFTKTHIATVIVRRPQLLSADSRKILKPKIEFFEQMGLVGPDLARMITSNPSVLCTRLDGKIISSVSFLKGILVTNLNVVTALKRDPFLLRFNLHKLLLPNIEYLRNTKVPESRISKLLMLKPSCINCSPHLLAAHVEKLKEMGCDPSEMNFIHHLKVMSSLSSDAWNKKMEIYRSFGWSDAEILTAFRRRPHFMLKCDQRIKNVMDFFMNRLHVKPEKFQNYLALVTFSLEKTVIPRCSVLNLLMLRGFLSKEMNMLGKIHSSKAYFLKRYVVKYQDEVPEVLEAYKGNIAFEGFGS